MLALKILGLWILLSCMLGPCLAWLFFYGERQRKYTRDHRHDHTSSPRGAAWTRWNFRLQQGNPASTKLNAGFVLKPSTMTAICIATCCMCSGEIRLWKGSSSPAFG